MMPLPRAITRATFIFSLLYAVASAYMITRARGLRHIDDKIFVDQHTMTPFSFFAATFRCRCLMPCFYYYATRRLTLMIFRCRATFTIRLMLDNACCRYFASLFDFR